MSKVKNLQWFYSTFLVFRQIFQRMLDEFTLSFPISLYLSLFPKHLCHLFSPFPLSLCHPLKSFFIPSLPLKILPLPKNLSHYHNLFFLHSHSLCPNALALCPTLLIFSPYYSLTSIHFYLFSFLLLSLLMLLYLSLSLASVFLLLPCFSISPSSLTLLIPCFTIFPSQCLFISPSFMLHYISCFCPHSFASYCQLLLLFTSIVYYYKRF